MSFTGQSIDSLFASAEKISDEMRTMLLEQAKDAAIQGETGWLLTVTHAIRDIEDSMMKLEPVGKRLSEIARDVLGFEDDDSLKTAGARLRRFRIPVTQGMTNQSLLPLAVPERRGLVRIGEQFKITLPNGQEFETDLISAGKKLRERGWIRDFYQQQAISEGDHVILEETAPGVWALTKDARDQSS